MSLNQLELDRHNELAAFLRSRRARVSPEQAGLPRGKRRRTPGLRREEVAMLAGVSSEWYTWLEQGRDIQVSVQVVERLASVLQLDADERAYVFLLALRQPPPVETFSQPMISPTLKRFLDQLDVMPACIVDARLNVMEQNAAHCAVFGNFADLSERERNLIWRLFSPLAQQRNEEWKALARVYLAQFRAAYGRFINDPWWASQIAELNRISPDFRELWPQQDVLNVSEGRKTICHPLVGELHFEFLWFQTVDSSDYRLLVHTPGSNSRTTEKMKQLLAQGTGQNIG